MPIQRLQQSGMMLCKRGVQTDVGHLSLLGLQLKNTWDQCMLRLLEANDDQSLTTKFSTVCNTCADLLGDLITRLHQLGVAHGAQALVIRSLDSEFARSCFLRQEAPGLFA